jgi:muconolactone delta-isomerase
MNDLEAFRILFCFAPADDEPDGPISEISKTVDQQPGPAASKNAARLDRVRKEIRQREAIMARQGTVVATWRTRHGRKVGPYYRLAWREDGRQKSLYLGGSTELAQAVRQILAELQRPLRVDRAFLAARKQGWAALRAHKIVLARELARYGLYLHGWEVRGWRNTTLFEKWPLPPEEPEMRCLTANAVAHASELPLRKNGPDVDQQLRLADPSPPANRRNRTPLTNGPVGRERPLLWPAKQNHPWQNHAGGASFCPPMILPPHDSAGLGSSVGSSHPTWSMADFALMASVSFASLWSCDRGFYRNAKGPQRGERHGRCVPRQDRPFRRNGPGVDQRARPADPLRPANWRNRILLTNGPVACQRSPPPPRALHPGYGPKAMLGRNPTSSFVARGPMRARSPPTSAPSRW